MTAAASAVTATVVDAAVDPCSPAAVIVNCVELKGQTSLDPLGSTCPTPWSIETVDAFVDDHVSVAH